MRKGFAIGGAMPGHSDWAKSELGLRVGYATSGAANKRPRVPGHSDLAKPTLGLGKGYATGGSAEKRPRMPGRSD